MQLILAVTSVAAAPHSIDQALQLGFGYFLGCSQFLVPCSKLPQFSLRRLNKFFILDEHPHTGLLLQDELDSLLYVHTI